MNKLIGSFVLVLVAQMAVAESATLTSFDTIPQNFTLDSEVWKTASDVATSWRPYNDGTTIAHVKNVGASASSSYCWVTVNFGGLIIDLSDRTTLSLIEQKAEKLTIGAEGVDVRNGRYFLGARDNAFVELTANQTWTGSHATGNTYFNIGDISGQMPNTPLVAADGVTSLTIGGRLQAAIYGHNNQLSAVTVTVKDSAMLRLPDTADARLGAAKLVLADAGQRMAFGSPAEEKAWYYPAASAWKPVDIVAIDHDHLAPVVELKDGAGFSAENGLYGLTNLCVSGTAGSTVTGDLTFTNPVNRVIFMTAGASLIFATANAQSGVEAGFDVSGPGTLTVNDLAPLTGAIVVNDGATFVLSSDGVRRLTQTVSGNGTLAVTGGTIYLPAQVLTGFTGPIDVRGATLVLDEPLPAGRVTVSGGGSVLYGTDPWIVTDTVRSEAELTVGKDEILRVFGNGLSAGTALKLNAGTLRFECSATVSSPVTITLDTSYIETAALAVTGSITGTILSDIPADGRPTSAVIGTATRGPGCLKLSGGGTWNKYRPNSFLTLDGSVWFCGGEYLFRNTSCGMYYTEKTTGTWGRHWLVTDGAKIKVVGYNNNYSTDLRVSGLEHTTNVSVLEVRDGGDVEIAENAYISLGFLQANGHLVVASGGAVRVTQPSGNIRFGRSTTTTGVVDLREGGVIETASPFLHAMQTQNRAYQTQGRFIWNGGTVKLLSNFPTSEASLFRNQARVNEEWTEVNGSLRTWVKIVGETCTLDLTDLPERESPLMNVPAGLERSEWFGTGTLTVKGGKPFVMQSFPNDITLKLAGDGTRVILPEDVEIHDFATRCATDDVEAGELEYETLKDRLPNLSLLEFVAAGRGVVLTNAEPSCAMTIGTARVTSDGEFVNAGTLVSPATVAVTNLVFAENAILGDAGGTTTFEALGDITLPSTSMRYEAFASPGAAAYRAQGSVIGSPEGWSKVGRHNRRVVVDAAAKEIRLEGIGFALIVR